MDAYLVNVFKILKKYSENWNLNKTNFDFVYKQINLQRFNCKKAFNQHVALRNSLGLAICEGWL